MKKVLLLIPLLVALVSCTKEVDTPQGEVYNTVTFTASAPQTKTVLGEKNGNLRPVLWSEGDAISVNGVVSSPLEASAAGKSSAEFTVSGVSAPFYAACPASSVSGYSNGTATVTIPSEQTYTEGTFDPAAYVMLASSDDVDFAFLPEVALFSITPTGNIGRRIRSVRLSSKGGVPLSGAFATDWNGITAGAGSSSWVQMADASGVDLGKPWVIAIAPADLTQDGLEVVITDSNGGVMTRRAKPSKTYEAGRLYTATIPYLPDTAPRALPYTEDFESYNAETIRSDWYFIDSDGDGYNWTHNLPDNDTFGCHSGTGVLTSASYINNVGPLTPDNWAFTPAIKLELSDNELSFWMAPQDNSYPEEHYAVYISTSVSTENCTRLVEGTLTKGTSYIYTNSSGANAPAAGHYKPRNVGTWEHFTVLIPEEFNGKVVHIAFRHFNCTDCFWINLDDISIKSEPSVSPGNPNPPDEPVPVP